MAQLVKNLPANAEDSRDTGSIPGSGGYPGVGNGNLFQYSSLENSMDRGAWWATAHGAAESEVTDCTCRHIQSLLSWRRSQMWLEKKTRKAPISVLHKMGKGR